MSGFLTKADINEKEPSQLDKYAEWKYAHPGGNYDQFLAELNNITKEDDHIAWDYLTPLQRAQIKATRPDIKQPTNDSDKVKKSIDAFIEKTSYYVTGNKGEKPIITEEPIKDKNKKDFYTKVEADSPQQAERRSGINSWQRKSVKKQQVVPKAGKTPSLVPYVRGGKVFKRKEWDGKK